MYLKFLISDILLIIDKLLTIKKIQNTSKEKSEFLTEIRSFILVIDRSSKLPFYRQLALIIKERVLRGDLSLGRLLPSEKELCEQYALSRITVRKALNELESEDIIERLQGKGSIVKEREILGSKVHGYTESMLLRGLKPLTKMVNKSLEIGSPELIDIFNFDSSASNMFWHFRRLCHIRDIPMSIMDHFVTKDLGDIMCNQYNLENVSFFSIFNKILNQPVNYIKALFAAVLATPEHSKLLNVDVGSPLMWFRGISYLDEKRPVEVNYAYFIGDRFQFETHMFRTYSIVIDKEKEYFA